MGGVEGGVVRGAGDARERPSYACPMRRRVTPAARSLALAAAGLLACAGATEPPAGAAAPTAEPPGVDAGDPGAGDATPDARKLGCGTFAGAKDRFVCAPDGTSRGRCPDGVSREEEACTRGCLRTPSGKDAVCMGTTTTWTCSGTAATEKAQNGDYFLTAFGCWVDAAGGKHGDAGDNCVPGCLGDLRRLGLCAAADTGRACEEKLTWFVADAGRFGCGARLRVENPANGAAVVAVAIDVGPACSVERTVQAAVLDASGRVNRELFGADRGVVDRSLVHVIEVDPSTPLGPAAGR